MSQKNYRFALGQKRLKASVKGQAARRRPASRATLARVARAVGQQYGIPVAPRYRNSDPKGVDVANLSAQIGTPLLTTSTTNAGVAVLNCVQTGSGSWNRNGRKIFLKSVRIRGATEVVHDNAGAAAATRAAIVRLVVVWDRNPNSGSIPTFDTIFGETSQTGTETSSVLSNLRWDNTGRFKVLRDVINLHVPNGIPQVAEEGILSKCTFDEFIKLDGLETIFSGQANPCTIGDISSGALYLYVRMDNNTANSTGNLITESSARLRFTE